MSLLTQEVARSRINTYAPLCQGILYAALDRSQPQKVNTITFNGMTLNCDFSVPGNLKRADDLLIPFINDMLIDAERLGMVNVVQIFSKPEVKYALRNGVSNYSFLEITKLLYPPVLQSSPSKILHVDFRARRLISPNGP